MKNKLSQVVLIINAVFRNWWKLAVIIAIIVAAAFGVLAAVGLTGVSIYTEKVQIVAPGGAHK